MLKPHIEIWGKFSIFFKVSSLGSTTTEEFEGEGGTIGSVTTDSDVRQSNEKSGKVKTYRMVLTLFTTWKFRL